MRTKYNHRVERIFWDIRWKRPFWDRSGSWLIIGVQRYWFSNLEYEYRVGFFGFDIRIWMKRDIATQSGAEKNCTPEDQ